MGVYVIIGIVALIIQIVISSKFANIAAEKGYDALPYGLLCFFFSVAGYCMVAALPDQEIRSKLNDISGKLNKLDSPAPITAQKSSPARASVNQSVVPANGWICTCGRANASYVSSCVCGLSKRESTKKAADSDTVKAEVRNGEKICPKCGTAQKEDRRVCWSCGAHFEN